MPQIIPNRNETPKKKAEVRRSFKKSHKVRREKGSIPLVGSSKITNLGSPGSFLQADFSFSLFHVLGLRGCYTIEILIYNICIYIHIHISIGPLIVSIFLSDKCGPTIPIELSFCQPFSIGKNPLVNCLKCHPSRPENAKPTESLRFIPPESCVTW